MNQVGDTAVTGRVTQSLAAVADAELVRLGEAKSLLNDLFKGAWNNGTTFNPGESVSDDGSFWISNTVNVNKKPAANPSDWRKAAAAGAAAYVYLAYADDAAGTGFTLAFNSSKDYIAVKSDDVADRLAGSGRLCRSVEELQGRARKSGPAGQRRHEWI
jgi:hypothetical protein